MNHDRVQNTVEFFYHGERIDGILFTYFHDDIEKYQTFMFNYKGNNIHIALKEDKQYYNVAPLHCEIIDKLGIEIHKRYDDYLSIIHDIERNYIIVDDEVYDYYFTLMTQSPKIYHVSIRLVDGTLLDGINKMTTIQERQNKMSLFKNLLSQVNYYFETKNIKPNREQLNIEKTKQYQETKKLINEIYESL